MEQVPIQPLQDYVLIEPTAAEAVTAGGIIVPNMAQEKRAEGIIIAKAADATDDVMIGDRVIYQRHAGHEIKIEGIAVRLVPSGDLLAKVVEIDVIPD